ncbi:hypothetical protein LX32DRAFT_637868 [Colletotrichum zoysiae]|uniref:Uncharacterized protein n=1 Tax=Colletotrichum zoysiae TaxID=1216348 RepID=A0AAD9M6J7_9PEZI|nr:hypothetical protein LX32DRAFT_637868 [Colletotrichum zoysiae]
MMEKLHTQVCVPQRCGLCGFELHMGDKIVAFTDGGRQTGEMVNSLCMDDGNHRQMRMGYCEMFKRCVRDCSHEDGFAIGCHAACVKHVPSTSRTWLLEVLAYQYEPSPSEIARRVQWMNLRLASTTPILRHAKPHLPQELRLQVAAHLLRGTALHRYAVAYANTLQRNKGSGDPFIRLSAEIWARYIDFEGVRYIASLANSSDDHHTEYIFRPDPTQNIASIYIAENFLGITQILFFTALPVPVVEKRQDLWWRVIPLRGDETMLATQNDGVKLRSITPEIKVIGPRPNHPLWSSPPLKSLRSVQLEPSPPAAQLLTLTCNAPEVTAYSVLWDNRIIHLHAHIPGEDFAFYKGFEGRAHAVWLYFPLMNGERISEIWTRCPDGQGSSLFFKTTYNRLAPFGPQPIRPPEAPTLIDFPTQDRGSRIFFESAPVGVRNLRFETPDPAPTSDSIRPPEPFFGHSRMWLFPDKFYSVAKLDGVSKIVPCQRHVYGERCIVGLLLEFPDGRQSCVGEIRLDRLQNPVQTSGHQLVWLGISENDYEPFVSAVTITGPDCDDGVSWFEMPLIGTLEWWYATRGCELRHTGKAGSPISFRPRG